MRDFVAESKTPEAVAAEAKTLQTNAALPADCRAEIVFNALFSSSIVQESADEGKTAMLAAVTEGFPPLQVSVINAVVRLCAATPALMKAAPLILKNLYDNDVIEDDAVAAWATSTGVQGVDEEAEALFRAKAQPFVTWVAEADEGSSSEEEDDDDE